MKKPYLFALGIAVSAGVIFVTVYLGGYAPANAKSVLAYQEEPAG